MNYEPNRYATAIAIALTFCICGLLYWLLQVLVTPPPVPPPTPTAALAPTLTPTATRTPSPTSTATPEPTNTPTLTPTATATPVVLTPAVALRHDAMKSVFYWYPERRDPTADAYIAVYDCGEMGAWYWLRLPDGTTHRVLVVDCMQAEHKAAHRALWGDTVVIELDGAFWRAHGLRMGGGVKVGIRRVE